MSRSENHARIAEKTPLRLLALLLLAGLGGCQSRRPPTRFLIPDGYIGWVRIDHEVAGAPEIPVTGGVRTYRVAATGHLETKTKIDTRWGPSFEFFYEAGPDLKSLGGDQTPDGRIFGFCSGEFQEPAKGIRVVFLRFFVGSKSDYESLGAPNDDGARFGPVKKGS